MLCIVGDGTFSFEEFVQVMANMGGISENPEEDEEKELQQAFKVTRTPTTTMHSRHANVNAVQYYTSLS